MDAVAAASEWISRDPDPDTRRELASLLDRPDELDRRFSKRLRFGTAGLRGPAGCGPSRMNRVVVRAAAAALAHRLAQDAITGPVIVGYDARPQSDVFAADTAAILATSGRDSLVVDGVVPTPVLAWLVLGRDAAAGVMVTASHNPRGDAGYKVFWSDGAQIIPPIDRDIEQLMDHELRVPSPPVAECSLGRIDSLPAAVAIAQYVETMFAPDRVRRSTRAVYTPLCGVGGATMTAACRRAGRPLPEIVESQFEPDGSFPGLPFPNPEEPAAWAEAEAVAERAGIDSIVANDPDADRLGVAIRDRAGWRRLTGSEIAALLTDHLLRQRRTGDRLVVSSNVSTRQVAAIASAAGARHLVTPSGFKWVIRAAIEQPELEWILGFEEALGFAVDRRVRDKDGITAAMAMLDIIEEAEDDGGLQGRLDRLTQAHGLFASRQISWPVPAGLAAELVESLRARPPATLADRTVWVCEADGEPIVRLAVGADVRVSLRPSGTEAKLKAYVDIEVPPPLEDLSSTRRHAERSLDQIVSQLSELVDRRRAEVSGPG